MRSGGKAELWSLLLLVVVLLLWSSEELGLVEDDQGQGIVAWLCGTRGYREGMECGIIIRRSSKGARIVTRVVKWERLVVWMRSWRVALCFHVRSVQWKCGKVHGLEDRKA